MADGRASLLSAGFGYGNGYRRRKGQFYTHAHNGNHNTVGILPFWTRRKRVGAAMQDDELRLFRLGIPQTFFSSFIKRTSLKFAFLLLIRLFFVCLVLEADLLTYNYQYRCTLGSHWAKKNENC